MNPEPMMRDEVQFAATPLGFVMRTRLPVVVIVGRPNVGKSTLFNRLVGRRVAVVEDTPGITRDRLYAETEWNGRRFQVVDTGGIVFSEEDPLSEQIRVQANVALEEADIVLFLTDARDGMNPDDMDLARELRPVKKPVLVVVNKADNPERDSFANEFYSVGLGEVYPVSGLHGRGVADLMDVVVDLLPPASEIDVDDRTEVRVAIVGRPNVGKSSMINAFTGEQRMIVSDIAGTTRDAIDTELEYHGEKFRLIDTAGIRRRGKIQGSVEYYMVDRAQKAIDKADCAMVVVDGNEGLTDGDKRIMKLAHDAGKAVVFAINKWDLKEPPDGHPRHMTQIKKDFIKVVKNEIPELNYATAAFTSAKESAGLGPALDEVLRAQEAYNFRISTGQLNRLIQEAVFSRPYSSKGRVLKIYYATQVSTRPPTFVLFCNDPELLHFSYQRYLLNKIREAFPLEGTPVRLTAKSSHKKPE
ncbi:ribosome biogenesis GTPase Der [Fimbriimonas ginsengisoli]|uniref:GTPase Der n=1 Tax=Fimbriimonas ginsengisoli Gsoil 348 TaxID=661478 RepID=A0A068NPR9_FIMGI|nr:ribosome biogenesis GTPase Der [Fimbriimonas ginsengisoli]AIE85441.1 GTP-binding protein EngA [Fimbriimonas ginsengisoli Gsoil 348]